MLPGALYSLLLAVLVAVAEWTNSYFTVGDGSAFSWAPIIVTAAPIAFQWLRVYLSPSEPEQPQAAARGLGVEDAQPSKARKFWLGA